VKRSPKSVLRRDNAPQPKKRRNQPLTNPPTYTSGEVTKILKSKVTSVNLERWDKSGVFRPSHYWANEKLLSRQDRDDRVKSDPSNRGNPERRYTYHDLVWLRLLIYVKEYFADMGIRRSSAKSAAIIGAIQKISPEQCPPAARLFFIENGDAYLSRDNGTAERLTADGQLAMRILLTDQVVAEVDGRISVLEANLNIRAIQVEEKEPLRGQLA
jgi:hypothetical protein